MPTIVSAKRSRLAALAAQSAQTAVSAPQLPIRQVTARVVKEPLQIADGVLGIVKNRSGEGGIRRAGREDLDEVIEGARAPGRDDGDGDGFRDGGGHLAIEAGTRPVPVDRRQQHFSGTATLGFASPLDSVPS